MTTVQISKLTIFHVYVSLMAEMDNIRLQWGNILHLFLKCFCCPDFLTLCKIKRCYISIKDMGLLSSLNESLAAFEI